MSNRSKFRQRDLKEQQERNRINKIQKEQNRLLNEYDGSGNDKNKIVNSSSQGLSNSEQRYKQVNAEKTGLDYGVLTPEQLRARYGPADDAGDAMDGGGSLPSSSTPLTSSFNHSRTRTYRERGGVLRYPFEALTEKTDYLQIDIVEYEPASKSSSNDNNFIGRPGSRRIPLRSRIPGGLSTQSLVNKGTVLLQIPSQVQDGNSVSYGESSMNTIVGAALQGATDIMTGAGNALGGDGTLQENLSAAGKSISDSVKKALGSTDIDGNNARSLITKKLAASVVNTFGGNVSVNQILARQEGQIFNPNMELLFNGVNLRNFRFSFKMTPRSQQEAEQCKLIIRTFKMNMAPKVTSGRGGQSLFLNTPNVFQLRYKSGFRNHPFMHKFKQCFLTDISVNYTGEGVYATYENREPVSMIMDLTFKELEPIYDQDYFNDRGRDLDSTVGF